jgi:hypothetical protein
MKLVPPFIRYDDEERHEKELERGDLRNAAWVDSDSMNTDSNIAGLTATGLDSGRQQSRIREPVILTLQKSIEGIGEGIV